MLPGRRVVAKVLVVVMLWAAAEVITAGEMVVTAAVAAEHKPKESSTEPLHAAASAVARAAWLAGSQLKSVVRQCTGQVAQGVARSHTCPVCPRTLLPRAKIPKFFADPPLWYAVWNWKKVVPRKSPPSLARRSMASRS